MGGEVYPNRKGRPYFCFRQIRLRLISVVLIVTFALAAFTLNEMATPISAIITQFSTGTIVVQKTGPVVITYTSVGYKGCTNFVFNHKFLSKLKEYYHDSTHKQIRVKSVEIPTKAEYFTWLSLRHNAEQIPPFHITSPSTFRSMNEQRRFVGGVDEVVEEIQRDFPEVDIMDLKRDLVSWRLEQKAKAVAEAEKKVEPVQEKEEESPVEQHEEDIETEIQAPEKQLPTATAAAAAAPKRSLVPHLEPQMRFKNRIVTAYRSAEGKTVTNHKPLWQYLKSKGWKFLWSAPAMASWTFVQDQTSAHLAGLKSKRSIINNIGWGGQSCYGGTKGAQMRCRIELAGRDGCSYDSLNVQPTQYRFWIPEECNQFFEHCNDPKNKKRLWIEKPSGGQHGVGMQVHEGCAKLKRRWGSCSSSFSKSKKWFVMQYIDPALLDGHKFDVRTYLLVASLNPVVVFYHDGFVRKAANLYSRNVKDRRSHITNAKEQDGAEDHFWDFGRLEKHLHEKLDFPEDYMRNNFRQHALKVQNFVFQAARNNMFKRKGSYQLFALDWIIDSSGGIHMLECNSNPLVTNYPIPGFPATWETMIDLIWKIQTEPAELEDTPLITDLGQRFSYHGWHLVFNELESSFKKETYNACAALKDLNKHPFAAPPELNISDIKESIETEEVEAEASAILESEMTPKEVVDRQVEENTQRKHVNLANMEEYECVPIKDIHNEKESVIRCVLAKDSPFTSYFYVLDAVAGDEVETSPVVVVVGGVHGNEFAGVVAARHVRRNWKPLKGRIVVVERANVNGVERGSRIIPNVALHKDLNRDFPDNLDAPPQGETAVALWNLIKLLKPDVFVDLHEGWGVYKQLKDNPHEKLVGNKAFSKGSSVISSPRAVPIAKAMLDAVNAEIKIESRKFLMIVPPVKNGLANRVCKAFNTLALVLETTSGNQKVEVRTYQHLVMLSTAFKAIGMLPADFEVTRQVETCVAGRKLCSIEHPGDEMAIEDMVIEEAT